MASNENKYRLNQDDKEYILSISDEEKFLKISCQDSKNPNPLIFTKLYTLEQLKTYEIFSNISSIEEASEILDKLLGTEKVGITESNNTLKVILYMSSGASVEFSLSTDAADVQLRTTPKEINIQQPVYTAPTVYNTNVYQGGVIQAPTIVKPVQTLPTITNPVTTNTVNAYSAQYNQYGYNAGYEQSNNNYGGVPDLPQPIFSAAGAKSVATNANVQLYPGLNDNNYDLQGLSGIINNTAQYHGHTAVDNATSQYYEQTGVVDNNAQLYGQTGVVDNTSAQYYGQTGIVDNTAQLYGQTGVVDNATSQYYGQADSFNAQSYDLNLNQFPTQYDTSAYQTNVVSTNYQQTNVPYQQDIHTEATYNQVPLYPQQNVKISTQVVTQTQQFTQKPEIDAASYGQSAGLYEAQQQQLTQLPKEQPEPQEPTPLPTQQQNTPLRPIGAEIPQHAVTDQRLQKDNEALRADLDRCVNQMNQYQNQIQSLTKEREKLLSQNQDSEINALRAENEAVKAQLAELGMLRRKVAEMEVLRSQLVELNSLRAKLAELNALKAQLNDLNNLKSQAAENGTLRTQLAELASLRAQAAETEQLRKKVEELENIRTQYEQEITKMRTINSQNEINYNANNNFNTNVNNNQELVFEKTVQQITVKGDIIHNTAELEMLTRKINKHNQKLTLNLLYKASADSDKALAFHEKCDDAQSSIVLVETTKGKRFGGFTTCSWRGDCIDKKDEDAFVFSLDKMMTYDNIPGEDAVGCYPKFGPIFLGCQIRIYDDAFTKGGTTFERGLNYNTEEDFELTGGDRVFGVKEIEVYEVIPQ